ncbi:hypothetical protein QYM36_019098 [Artemia franciscana]|uniref:Uncharacterized protein n=1 Tax=Artemia franciscana TaxID=6661 RepID=A0AA88H5P7_ARTSF|nr:hypothetical protein QYM36_019098 [Artemia franciscana]
MFYSPSGQNSFDPYFRRSLWDVNDYRHGMRFKYAPHRRPTPAQQMPNAMNQLHSQQSWDGWNWKFNPYHFENYYSPTEMLSRSIPNFDISSYDQHPTCSNFDFTSRSTFQSQRTFMTEFNSQETQTVHQADNFYLSTNILRTSNPDLNQHFYERGPIYNSDSGPRSMFYSQNSLVKENNHQEMKNFNSFYDQVYHLPSTNNFDEEVRNPNFREQYIDQRQSDTINYPEIRYGSYPFDERKQSLPFTSNSSLPNYENCERRVFINDSPYLPICENNRSKRRGSNRNILGGVPKRAKKLLTTSKGELLFYYVFFVSNFIALVLKKLHAKQELSTGLRLGEGGANWFDHLLKFYIVLFL